ncbi:MAG: 30S ribosomal protein S6 [Candidatus Wildermuthbacteria bacterium]|nr:30S ribosomal protein S6 [Candidatus Wildermuthbacteria bacterium]
MRNYQHTLILSPLLTEDEVSAQTGRLVSFIQEQGGILEKQAITGRRPLAHPLGKHNEGYVVMLQFLANPEKQLTINKKLKEEDDVLRFLPLVFTPRKERPKKIRTVAQQGAVEPASQQDQTTEAKEEAGERITIEAIDKKLDEIFKEEQK